jgi:shikimate kinase
MGQDEGVLVVLISGPIASGKSALGRAVAGRLDDQLWVMDADGDRQTRLPLALSGLSLIGADWHA